MKKYFPYAAIALVAIIALGASTYYARTNKKVSNSPNTTDSSSMHGISHEPTTDGTAVAQSHRSYNLQLTSSPENIQSGQPTKVSYKIVNDKGEVLKDYTVAHEKIMHFILVRKDLRNFQHLHPDFDQSSGEFTVNVTFPTDGPYRIFPDFTPTPENPQKLTVTVNKDLNVGDLSKYKAQAAVVDTATAKSVDGFKVNYYMPEALKSQTQVDFELVVEKSGETVTLEPYLGAMGHSVILREGNLDFIHAHAAGMDTEGMDNVHSTDTGSMQSMNHQPEPDTMDFSTSFPEPGIYKIFTQFQVKGRVMTTDYTVNVK